MFRLVIIVSCDQNFYNNDFQLQGADFLLKFKAVLGNIIHWAVQIVVKASHMKTFWTVISTQESCKIRSVQALDPWCVCDDLYQRRAKGKRANRIWCWRVHCSLNGVCTHCCLGDSFEFLFKVLTCFLEITHQYPYQCLTLRKQN